MRAILEGGKRRTGVFTTLADDRYLILADASGSRTLLPLAEVRDLQVLAGRERVGIVGFLGTWLGAAGAGAALGAISWEPCSSTGIFSCMWHPSSRRQAARRGAVIGSALGVPVGLLVASLRTDRWAPAVLPEPPVTAEVAPPPGRPNPPR